MKRMALGWAAVVAAVLVCNVTVGDVTVDGVTPGQQTMDLEAAKTLAKEKQLPILLNFSGSDWCGWCKLMERNVFSKPEWTSFAVSNVVMVLVDFPNDKALVPEKYVARNKELKEKFPVAGFPTFILLEQDGETVLGKLGAGREKTPESFAGEIQALTRNRAAAVDAYVKTLSPENAVAYRKILADIESAKAEQKSTQGAISEAEKRLEALAAEIVKAEEAARDFRVGQLGEAAQAEYATLKAEHAEAKRALEAWLDTKPARSQETMETFKTMSGRVQTCEGKISQY